MPPDKQSDALMKNVSEKMALGEMKKARSTYWNTEVDLNKRMEPLLQDSI